LRNVLIVPIARWFAVAALFIWAGRRTSRLARYRVSPGISSSRG